MCIIAFVRSVVEQAAAGQHEAVALLSQRKLLIMPVANPDGYAWNEKTHPRGGRSTFKVLPLGSMVPQLGACTSSARAWWLCAARHSWGRPRPVESQPPPQLLELPASKVANIVRVAI